MTPSSRSPWILAQLFSLLALLMPLGRAGAQSLEGSGFQLARPGYSFEFPRDHGSHEEFRTEWWYFTGHLFSESGSRYGFELTFFRVGVDPQPQQSGQPETPWDLRNIGLAHFALTDVGGRQFRYYEKLNRFSPFLAGARTGSLSVFNEGWDVRTLSDGTFRLRAKAGGDGIDLILRSVKPPAVHGQDGISVKAAGEGFASHYYSLSRLQVSGRITVAGKASQCSGLAWMDHEFGSASLRDYQQGWDWFSIQLDNGTELMLYVIRRTDGSADGTSSGSIILSDGRVIHLRKEDFVIEPRRTWKSPASNAVYPMGWRIRVQPFGLELEVRELLQNQELVTKASTQVTYWEGAVTATGRFGGTLVSGSGYVELTGYDKPFR